MNSVSDIITDHITGIMPQTPITNNLVNNQTSFSSDDSTSDTLGFGDQRPTYYTEQTTSKSSTPDTEQIKLQLYKIKDDIDSILRQLDGNVTRAHNFITTPPSQNNINTSEQIIEGVFNGEKMIGPDGHEYAVPPNYASKSKIVEGDMMKLTITNAGKFIYKQIGPVKRRNLVGTLVYDEHTQFWYARVIEKNYKILTASVTFYKGKPGDEVVILIPQGNRCDWGAVDNIISK